MKAIRVDQFGAPEVMRCVETIDPEVGPGQVRVRLQAIGVNPVDTYWRAGMNPALKLPYTPGLDGAGVVDQVGAGVTTCRVGDRVYLGTALPCTYAELAAVPAARVFALPASCSFEAGAALHVPYATAHRALFHRGQGRAGETVFIHGASGAVGLAATQFARAHGFRVIGSAGSEAGRRLALEQGLHHVVDHKSADYLDEVKQWTGGCGVDLVLEMLANANLGGVLGVLSPKGRVVVIGSRGPAQIVPRDLMSRDADVRGMSLFNASDAEIIDIHSAVRAGLESGVLRPVIRKQMGLAEAARAHVEVMEPGACGKIVLRS